jgi:hypothetical protein
MSPQYSDDSQAPDGIAVNPESRAGGWRLLGSWLALALVSWLLTGVLVSATVWFARWFSTGG